MKVGYLKELDGVRAIAALMVMFFHFSAGFQAESTFLIFLKKIFIFGQTGVSLFFVLSGFLITRILLNSKNKPNYFKNFYLKRVLRIFPLYFFFLIVFYFLLPFLKGENIADFNSQIYYWFYLQNFAMTFNWNNFGPLHFWSLAVEEHFYMFWPVLIYYLNEKNILISIFSLILVSILVRLVLVNFNYEVFYFTFSRLDELALGALLAHYEIKNKLNHNNAKYYFITLLFTIIPTLIIWNLNKSSGNSIVQVLKFLLLSVTYFCVIALVISAKSTNFLKKLLSCNILSFIGKVSYGLYVYHPLCFWIFSYYFATNYFLVNIFGSFLISIIVSSLSYYLLESKFLKLKNKFILTSN